ncbi:MAG: PilT/PilU family type 4a pilus ATPase [Planctomycetota bacterium]
MESNAAAHQELPHVGSGGVGIKKLLAAMARLDASDLHIKVGIPPTYRIGGALRPIQTEPVSEDEADHLIDPILTEEQQKQFAQSGNLDFAWHLEGGDRFRINMYRSGNHTHMAARRVKADIPSYGDLHLPPIYGKIVSDSVQGLVMVVGVTGSGKSSTLAAMVDQVNKTRAVNIITVEDPVEYRFKPAKSIVSQREIGIDVESFAMALRYVVRQDPDVILVGEMRDQATVMAALQAAETGHLVFATLHTADATQAFTRILEFFPESERGFIRNSLASSLRAICAQKLLPTTQGFESAVVPATEVLIATPLVRDKIREAEDEDLPSIIANGKGDGMHNFNQSLGELVEKEWIELKTARQHAPNREALEGMLKGVEVKAATLVGKIKNRG